MNKHFLIAIFFIISFNGFAQTKWLIPLEENHSILEGRLYDGPDFARLPPDMEQKVRAEVWNLSRQSAGLSLVFTTRSPSIMVEYTVSRPSSMPHMPATGVSGVDLYAMDMHGKWDWVKGNYSFKDTIRYEFTIYHNARKFEKFRLFLPLYNQVENLRIGVKEDYQLIFSIPESQAPIIVYGTSIAQGACASRPAMSWTNILRRKIDYPVVNMGFSGNGLLEKELIEFIAGHEASLYVLYCLPNLIATKCISEEEIRKSLII
ncbi:MAG: SGNH/GDSL hydrolase family protein [Cyclobacteriaceae bacterium]|nr:SGNH/GDSL hydrolase family protein [Cyclobacteriaceae bacterium]